VKEHAFVKTAGSYDLVITGNSGYPLDQNLYQCVKGVSAAARIVRKGGAILMCGECCDGIPAHGKYLELLQRGGSPQGVLDMLAQPGFSAHDQWQVQIQAQIQQQADVYVHANGLSDDEIRRALFLPARDAQSTLNRLLEQYGTRVCVLPMGPETVPVRYE
jgi:nickel-dependent lactate racemase